MKASVAALAVIAGSSVSGVVVNHCQVANQVAMNFDEGPTYNYDALLQALQSGGVKVTFHVISQFLNDPAMVSALQAAHNAGHQIGLRSEPTWPDLSTMPDNEIISNFAQLAESIKAVIGTYPRFVRLPYPTNTHAADLLTSYGVTVTEENLDSFDYENSTSTILSQYSQIVNGSSYITLHRDSAADNIAVMPQLLDLLHNKSMNVVTLTGLCWWCRLR